MKLKNRYYLLRHGETIYQTKKKHLIYPFPEPSPIKLTGRGQKQIGAAAKKLKGKSIDAIYSSDYFRTRQTSGIVAKELGTRVIFDKRLREINMGVFRGGLLIEYHDFFSDVKQRFTKRVPKGESWNDVKKRLSYFLKDVEKKRERERILIVSHADPLWLLWGVAQGKQNRELLGLRKRISPRPGGLLGPL